MMSPNLYLSESNEQDVVYKEIAPIYTTVDSEPSLSYPQLQPAAWQHASGEVMNMDCWQPWQTSHIMNNNGPVMFDWQSDPIEAWDLQRRDLAANVHDVQAFAPPATSFCAEDVFPGPPIKLETTFGANHEWQTGWVEHVTPAEEEVVPSVEGVSVEMEASNRAAKRRRRSIAPSTRLSDYAPTVGDGLVGLSPIQPIMSTMDTGHQHLELTMATQLPGSAVTAGETSPQRDNFLAEERRRSSTTESPAYVGANITSTVLTNTAPPMPMSEAPFPLMPSVRVIDDGRDSAGKPRQGIDAVFKTQSANTKRGHYASDVWEQHKGAIKKLYIDEGRPLREVIKTMEVEHHFPATQRMYKARFKQWGFVKNNTEKVVSQILRTKFERDAAGKLSQFTRNGKDVNLQTYLQRKGMTEYDLVDFQAGPDTLAHVRCRTPPLDVPQDLRLPDRLRFQDTLVLSFKRAFLLWRQQEQDSAFDFQPSVFTWRVTDFPHLSSLIESARQLRLGDGARGVAALNRAFWAMESYLTSMDATASFYFFFHRQSRPWQDDARVSLAVWKFLAAYAAARNHGAVNVNGNGGGSGSGSGNGNGNNNSGNSGSASGNHPLFHAFKLMYEVIQKEGVAGLRELLAESSNVVADELERSFGKDHWLKDLIWHRCFPEKSKLRHLQLIRDLRDHGPTKKIVTRLY